MGDIERYDGELVNLRVYAKVAADQLRRHNRELSESGAEAESLREQLRGAVEALEQIAVFLAAPTAVIEDGYLDALRMQDIAREALSQLGLSQLGGR